MIIIEKELTEKIKEILENDPSAFAIYDGRPEITRKTALAILKTIKEHIGKKGGKFRTIKQSITEKIDDKTVFKVSTTLEIETKNENNETITIEEQAFGLCSTNENENLHDCHATAETRSIKRVVEELLGEDLINKIALKLMKNPNNEKNTNYTTDNNTITNKNETEKINLIDTIIKLAKITKYPITKMIEETTGLVLDKPQTIEELKQKLLETETEILMKTIQGYEKHIKETTKVN